MTTRICIYSPTYVCVCAVTQSCPSLCSLMDCSPSGFSVHGMLQARILEWLPFPSPGDLSDLGIKLAAPVTPALACGYFYH